MSMVELSDLKVIDSKTEQASPVPNLKLAFSPSFEKFCKRYEGRKSIKQVTPMPALRILLAVDNNGVITRTITIIRDKTSRKYFGIFFLKASRMNGENKNNTPNAFSSICKFKRSNIYIDSTKSVIN